MTVNKITMCLAACFLLASQASSVEAQFDEPMAGHDLQFFSPVELDFENLPKNRKDGLFFRYDKLSWAITGERTEIGDPTQVVLSEQIFSPTNPNHEGAPPPQYQIFNSITDAPPEADFSWGERYEFGKFDNGNGWFVGILDGPEVHTFERYGFLHPPLPGNLNINTAPNFLDLGFDLTAINLDQLPSFGSASEIPTTASGFGSVHVNFATPAGFLLGFRDYVVGTGSGPTAGGPGPVIVGAVVAGDQVTEVIVSEDADGLADDLDGDTLNGFFFILADLDGDGTAETIVGNGADFDDLHTFNITFDRFDVRNITETQGVEIMRTIDLNNNHRLKTKQNNHVSIGYGVRYLRIRDEFYWEGSGGIFGRTLAETKSQNSITGPQIRATWENQRGRWSTLIDGRCLFGYNVQDTDQYGLFGETARPGGLNESVVAQPNTVRSGRNDDNFSPVVEFRAETSYRITNSVSARLGYTAIFIDNITRASQVMRWSLPDYGILEGGNQDVFINGANFGFDVVY